MLIINGKQNTYEYYYQQNDGQNQPFDPTHLNFLVCDVHGNAIVYDSSGDVIPLKVG
ncbi:hypothetical protein HSBAA_41750 [Vreelandella sulfidaeris]|uniref:Uncharacterized protein n=1 Tax=Vreelandella sulfidaeris TaxID=115553 RepID=A0A455UF23_9GAMM|nr:hypothetical protein HSBAA_41750 [Halomonas sulfidaeris]